MTLLNCLHGGGWDDEGNINVNPLIVFSDDTVMLDPASTPWFATGDDALLPRDTVDLDEDGDMLE